MEGRRRRQVETNRVCSGCGANKTYINKNGYLDWFKDGKGGYWCKKCRSKYIDNPKWDAVYSSRRFCFKGQYLRAEKEPKNGVCNFCRSIVGQISAQTGRFCYHTDRAHMSYHDDNPLKDTIELCDSCHRKYDGGIPFDRLCCVCGKETYIVIKTGHAQWYKLPGKDDVDKFECTR